MHKEKAPLYRRVNAKTYGVKHNGGDFKDLRHAKNETRQQSRGSMHGKQQRGLDYTPLYHFLLSKVGMKWDDIYSEAKSRLITADPIFHIVAIDESDKRDFVRTGESTYFSGMYIDGEGLLQITNPTLTAKDMKPFCSCCTHTFNGVLFGADLINL